MKPQGGNLFSNCLECVVRTSQSPPNITRNVLDVLDKEQSDMSAGTHINIPLPRLGRSFPLIIHLDVHKGGES